jgi:hypothetical protein
MAVLLVLRILLIQLSVRSGAKPDGWIQAGSGDSKMCAGGTAECTSAQTCTYHAYGPCGGATEPAVYFEAQIEGIGLIYDTDAYITDPTGGHAMVVEASNVANNGYTSSNDGVEIDDGNGGKAEVAYLSSGAWFGENPSESGGFLGMAAFLLKKGTVTTKSNSVVAPANPGDTDLVSAEVCISDLDGEECGAERTFNEGEYKFSVYGYTYGSNYQMPEKATHFGIRTKLSLVGAEADLRINDDFLTIDEIGSADVKKIVVSETAEGGRSVTIDFPQKYNVGVTSQPMKPSATKDIKIKISKGPEGEQAVFIDYLFERFEKSLEFFIYDPTVTDSTKISFDTSYGSREVFGLLLLLIVPGLVD